MYVQQNYSEKIDEIRHVLPASAYALLKVPSTSSPFRDYSIIQRIIFWIRIRVIKFTEYVLGEHLYIENTFRELAILEPRSRALLTTLVQQGIVPKWHCSVMNPDAPPIHICSLDIRTVELPDGGTIQMKGSTGGGTGKDIREAMIPALGELLERYSFSTWNTKHMIRGSFEQLKDKGAVTPTTFTFYSKRQLADKAYYRSIVSPETEMDWIPAQTLEDKTKRLVPAQLAYMFYSRANQDEPVFWVTTSNGAAAGVSFDMAAYRALCEAIERDAFLVFWLNKIPPPQIDLNTITIPAVREALEMFDQNGINFYILDVTTDISIPTFVGLIVDKDGPKPVCVSAVCDFDVQGALSKLAQEALKFLHFGAHKETIPIKAEDVTGIDERQLFWSQGDSFEEILFLTEGVVRPYDTIEQFPDEDFSVRLRRLRDIFTHKQYMCFFVDVTAQEARQAGLTVIRAIAPDLMPIYFEERNKYLGVQRLYTTPISLGYRGAKDETDLNPTPHPFL